jgi:hypothetical protein
MFVDMPYAMVAQDTHDELSYATNAQVHHDRMWYSTHAEDVQDESRLRSPMGSPNPVPASTPMEDANDMMDQDTVFSFDAAHPLDSGNPNHAAIPIDHTATPLHQGPSMLPYAPMATMGGQHPIPQFTHHAMSFHVHPQYLWDPPHWSPVAAVMPVHQPMTPETPATSLAGSVLNALPPEKVTYRAYAAKFRSMADVRRFESRVRWKPPHDDILPVTDDQMLPFVQRIYASIVDFTGFHDKIESRNKLNRLVAQRYSQEEIEAKCWQAVVSGIHASIGACV